MKDIQITTSSDILKYKDLYNYNFVIIKDLMSLKQNILVLKKIVSKFPHIMLNGLKEKELYVLLNYFLNENGINYLYREYKILIKGIGCNAKCPMCFDWKRSGNLEKQIQVLDSVIDDIILENIEFKNVDILGGEPLLIYKKILEILKRLKEKNISLTFTTNASLLDQNRIDELIDAGLETFVFSLDFPNENHNTFRSLENTFEKIVEFTNYIKSRGKKVNWNTVVGKFNTGVILDFEKLYSEVKPNKHTFILIEENYKTTNNSLMPENDVILELEKELILKLDNKGVEIVFNGFRKNIEKSNICHVPLYKKSYIIKNNKVNISPCYTHSHIKDFHKFTDTAIKGKCKEICDSSFRNKMKFI